MHLYTEDDLIISCLACKQETRVMHSSIFDYIHYDWYDNQFKINEEIKKKEEEDMPGKKSRTELVAILSKYFDSNKLYSLSYGTLVSMNTWTGNPKWDFYRIKKEEGEIKPDIIKFPSVDDELEDNHMPSANDAGAALADLILPHMGNKISKIAVSAVASARNELADMIDKEMAKRTVRIEIRHDDKEEPKKIENAHKQVPMLINIVNNNVPVYLFGAPGGGKSTAARQVADALNLDFYYFAFSNQTTSSRLIGYMDAKGEVVTTPTTKSYKEGGLILFDEVDKASPAVLAEMHGMIANKQGSFPDGIFGMHDNWRVICAANTPGNGAVIGHESSTKMDIAFIDRFVYMEWMYDEALESMIAKSIFDDSKTDSWIDWVRKVRKEITNKKGAWKLVATPRTTMAGAELLRLDIGFKTVADMAMFKGADSELKNTVLAAVPLPY